jgi:hypothetical protein
MTNILPVPHVSQIAPGALMHNNDCGAASVLMVLRSYNLAKDMTVDQVYDQLYPVGDAPLHAGVPMRSLALAGITNDWRADVHTHDMYDTLVMRCPIIALIHYAPLVDAGLTEKTGFRGAHFVVVIGMDIENIYIHDPYSLARGIALPVPVAVWNQAWTQCNLDGNSICAGIFVTLPIRDLSVLSPVNNPGVGKYEMGIHNGVQVNGLNVRSGNGDNYPVVKTLWRATAPFVLVSRVIGDRGLLADGSGWVYMAYLRKA